MSATYSFITNTGQTSTPLHPFNAVAGQTAASAQSFVFTPVYHVDPAQVFVANTTQTISPAFNSTSQTMATSRPLLEHMIVSVNRHKLANDDTDWTTQFPLKKLRITPVNPITIDQFIYSRLQGEIMENLRNDTDAEGLTIVWVMSTTNQLGIVRDNDSLKAAILDYQHTGKHIVQLYIIRGNGDATILPEYPIISSKTVTPSNFSFSKPPTISPIPSTFCFQPLAPQTQQTQR
ncbi:hypothetical protein D6C91_00746 [Aureobasidium pullulans]|uniref:Uncharacterized protein n=1 Tax=Aureobasidium pullulans TaxID=5580 RepID=A0A4V4KMQ8_AURPU|nr:hypothetical protein D6C97_02084 [Aureobasidium pullulans]THZ31621.1 hypothetical protein D6C91_00746 [Aureobasidium pullulans]